MATPMMQQYLRIKAEHPDALLLYRMGDFYELFHDDARTASRVLGIALTSREKGEGAIPMAGVPVRNVHPYLRRLLRAGHRVAVCEQLQDVAEAKTLVQRGVVRVVTPGTLTEEELLDGGSPNHLAAIAPGRDRFGVAWTDLSTGTLEVEDVSLERLEDVLTRVAPVEVLLAESLRPSRPEAGGVAGLIEEVTRAAITYRSPSAFERRPALRRIREQFQVAGVEGFGLAEDQPSIGSCGAVLDYLAETQRTALGHLRGIRPFRREGILLVDRAAQRGLELVEAGPERKRGGSLLGTIDRTCTAMGARGLRAWLLAPLASVEAIRGRHAAVAELVEESGVRDALRERLTGMGDLERLLARVACERATPRDLGAVRDALGRLPGLRLALGVPHAAGLREIHDALEPPPELVARLQRALVDTPPLVLHEGGIVREGFDEELDELHRTGREGKSLLLDFEARERERSSIPNLRVGFHRVFGYYLEVPRSQSGRVPPEWHRKQTLKSVERYGNPELRDLEEKLLHAADRAREREVEIFGELRAEVAGQVHRLQEVCDAVARLDAFLSLAQVAADQRWVRPEMAEDLSVELRDSRHPVVESTVAGAAFVPNDCMLTGEEGLAVILTGPNMAGKSTYIRQVALAVILAQAGSFVPAREARIGVADRVFARIGAADDLARGASTFMVEMAEIANVLRNATPRSLVVLDEVGRGTSTFDGLAVAWAVLEDLVGRVGCRTLAATHYHQLTDLAGRREGIRNFHVTVREWGDEVIFLHRIAPGRAEKSFGVHVAKLAGVPQDVVARAHEILKALEETSLPPPPHVALEGAAAGEDSPDGRAGEGRRAASPSRQASLPRPRQLQFGDPDLERVAARLRELRLEETTPLQALRILEELRGWITR